LLKDRAVIGHNIAASTRIPSVKYLIDTNVFIPLEPTGPPDLQAITERVIAFAKRTNEAGFPLFVHPAQSLPSNLYPTPR
jgi:hypothetical protein